MHHFKRVFFIRVKVVWTQFKVCANFELGSHTGFVGYYLNELVSTLNYKDSILTVTQCQSDIISKDWALNCTAGCR